MDLLRSSKREGKRLSFIVLSPKKMGDRGNRQRLLRRVSHHSEKTIFTSLTTSSVQLNEMGLPGPLSLRTNSSM